MSRSPSPLLLDPTPARFRAGLCARWVAWTLETCRERSTSCAASSVGDASKGRSRRELSRSRARHRRRRLPVRSTSRAPSNRRAIPSNSVRSPACGPETDQLLLALGRGANQHQHAFGLWLHPRLQIDTVRPHVNVAARRQIALLPPLILVFPLALEPGDHRRREVRRVLAEQGRENLLKIACRNPAQIEHRQERIEALRSSRPFRQDRRGEANALTRCRRGAIASFRLLHFDRANPGLDRANRIMSVANNALAAIRKDKTGVQGKERVEFDLDSLQDQLACPPAKDFGERIVDFVFLWE